MYDFDKNNDHETNELIAAAVRRVMIEQEPDCPDLPMTHYNFQTALAGIATIRDSLGTGEEYDDMRMALFHMKEDLDQQRVDLFLGQTSRAEILKVLEVTE